MNFTRKEWLFLMEEKPNDWATPSMKEFEFWRDGMTPDEFEKERDYFYTMISSGKRSEYKPLWKMNNQ